MLVTIVKISKCLPMVVNQLGPTGLELELQVLYGLFHPWKKKNFPHPLSPPLAMLVYIRNLSLYVSVFIHLGTWKYIWIHISILSRIKIRFCCFVRFIGLWKIILIFIHMQRVTFSTSCFVKALCYKHEISFSYYVKLSWNGTKISHVKSKGN